MNLSYSKEELKNCIERLKTNYKDWGCDIKEVMYLSKSCSVCKCKYDDPDGECLLDVYYYLT